MTAPPPLHPRPKRKITTIILVVCACISTLILVVLLIGYLDREGIVMFRSGPVAYYYPDDLKAMNLPAWHVTNAIPLSPDQATLAAMRHLSLKYPTNISWEVDKIDLEKEFDSVWTYTISLVDRASGRDHFEVIKVLMNGNVWRPDGKRQQ
jgi:hypothetical protein